MTQPRDYIAIVDKRREKEKKEEKAGHMCTSYRSDTIIEITVNDRQRERGGRRLSKFMADSRILRRITNAHFAEIRAFSRPTLKYFQSNWPAG